jgi:poly(A) polymerase
VVISKALLGEVGPVAERFRDAGFQLFLVGGIVRDELLERGGRNWADIDLATDARPSDTKRIVDPLASAVWTQGERFGTIGCKIREVPYEITTFRGEAYDPDSRKPVVVFADALESDLSRRDFTINAMAVDAMTGALHDPFDGRGDLAARVLRTPLGADTSFSDDPLRMLRAARFLARFSLDAAPDLADAIARQRDRLAIVSAERVRDELHKLLRVGDPTRGIEFLVRHGLLELWLPELAQLADVHDPAHGGIDALTHTMQVVAGCAPVDVLRLAALLHDIATVDGVLDHPSRGAGQSVQRLAGLRHSIDEQRDVRTLVALHHRLFEIDEPVRPSEVRRVLHEAGESIDALVAISYANARARRADLAAACVARVDLFVESAAALGETAADLVPELDGDAAMSILGIEPGREVGAAQRFLLELRLTEGRLGVERVTDELLAWWRSHH